MNNLPRPAFVIGRMKPRIEPVTRSNAPMTDREALRLLVEDMDILNAERIGGGLWLLTQVPAEVVEYLVSLDAEIEGMEEDPPEGGTENGGDPDEEPDADGEDSDGREDERCIQ